MDSRSLAFADEIRSITGGRGMDVVLNSLAGDYIPKSLSVLAPGGRFVEIGKSGIWDPTRVAALRRDVSYFVVDLAGRLRKDPGSLRLLLQAILESVERGDLKPLPRHVFPLAEAARAFRFMAQARHIGKIVITQPPSGELPVRADGTYLVTGGLRGLGLLVARWLVDRGARHLVLMGRGAPSEDALAVIRDLEGRGARVVVERGDVSRHDAVRGVLERIGEPPLRGVVHSAGILDDGALSQQDWDRFAKVMAPKVEGAWCLHRLTEDAPLDFFILFSSAASLVGSPGQGNHAAANAFLDALAHRRRALGLPAMSINWGVWSEVGAAADRGVAKRVALQGMGSFSPQEGLQVFERLLAADPIQVGVMPVDWPRFRLAHRVETCFLKELEGEVRKGTTPAPVPSATIAPGLRKQLEGIVPKERKRLILAHVRAQAVKVLGLDPAEDIDPRRPLSEMGLDSLMAVELRNLLGVGLGGEKSLPATLVFDHPSIAELADYLAQEVLDLGADSPPRPESGGSLLDRIERLSDDEVDRLLSAGTPRTEP